ncbi:MAG: GNAT family N-acetyltransferase, partial [Planctomycetes bacterium]|nr:GNAT family N-acetyltransferase [Planctomycetota bacterium]
MSDAPEGDNAPIDLGEFETKIVLREMRIEDYEPLREMQLRCFPGMLPWGRDQIESCLERFPEGQLVLEVDGSLAGSCSSLIVDFDMYHEWANWREIADSGYIRNHDYEGDTLYGIEIMVDPEFRGMKLARRLYEGRKALCRRFNCERIIIGGRIPGYHKYADRMSARDYVGQVITRGVYDPVLTTQIANGFVLKRLIPDYMPSDEESRGYATFLEWVNLDHVPEPKKRSVSVALVRIAAVNYQMRQIKTFEEFEWQCEFFIDTASDWKSDFVLFPELVTTQLLSFTPTKTPADAARKLATMTPRYLEFFTNMAIRYNINIVGGSQFAIEGDELRNVSYLFRRDGTLERQYKIHIT